MVCRVGGFGGRCLSSRPHSPGSPGRCGWVVKARNSDGGRSRAEAPSSHPLESQKVPCASRTLWFRTCFHNLCRNGPTAARSDDEFGRVCIFGASPFLSRPFTHSPSSVRSNADRCSTFIDTSMTDQSHCHWSMCDRIDSLITTFKLSEADTFRTQTLWTIRLLDKQLNHYPPPGDHYSSMSSI